MSQDGASEIGRDVERRTRRRRLPPMKVLLPLAAALGAGAAVAAAAIPGNDKVIHACYVTDSVQNFFELPIGSMRVIDPSQPSTLAGGAGNPEAVCTLGEATLDWNQQGPQGPPGIQGPPGESGAAGQQGAKGDQGVTGTIENPATSFGLVSGGVRFLKLSSASGGASIKGETTDKVHAGDIEITSFAVGITNPTSLGSATGGAGAGKVTFSTFTITKKVDKTSPALLADLLAGAHFSSADVLFSKGSGKKQVNYLDFRFSPVQIASINVGAGANSSTETVSFNFAKLSETFQDVNSKGQKTPAVTVGWNKVTNQTSQTVDSGGVSK